MIERIITKVPKVGIMSGKGTITHITRINSTCTSTITTCRCSLSTCRDTTDAFSTRCAGCRKNWSGEPTKYPAPVLLLYHKAIKVPLFVKFPNNHKGECQGLLENEPAVRRAGSISVNRGQVRRCAGRRGWSLPLFICAAM